MKADAPLAVTGSGLYDVDGQILCPTGADAMQSSTRSPLLDRLIARQRKEAEEIRAKYGDPEEFLRRVVRSSITPEGLEEAFQESINGGSIFDADETDER